MPGFFGIINSYQEGAEEHYDISLTYPVKILETKKTFEYCFFKRFVIPKFLDDKIFEEDSDVFICTDGTILNSGELKKQSSVSSLFLVFKKLFENDLFVGINVLRGDFSGFIYDKKTHELKIFTNYIGSKPVFYYFDREKEIFIFASELKMVIQAMKKTGIVPRFSEEGAYCLVTFGHMLDDITLAEGVRKVPPGTILSYHNGEIRFEEYFRLRSTPYIEAPEAEIIGTLHTLFRNAIKLEYDKDREYGYSHIVTLSGGLDSRMNILNAHEMGYSNLYSLTFSESNYLDESIAKKISSDYGFDFIFHSLDNGNYLKNIEQAVDLNDGLALYSGAAHVQFSLNLLNWEKFGLLHTGQTGDAVMGSFLKAEEHKDVDRETIRSLSDSSFLWEKIPKNLLSHLKKYENDEIFRFYERCVNGTFNGYRIIEHFTEYSSPFLDRDFLEYAMRIHPKFRYREKIYGTWIVKKMPGASAYIWEKTRLTLNAGPLQKAGLVVKQIFFKITGKQKKNKMNPFDYWYEKNPLLRKTMDEFFSENIGVLHSHTELQKDVAAMYDKGNVGEKTQVLTLLAAVKKFFP